MVWMPQEALQPDMSENHGETKRAEVDFQDPAVSTSLLTCLPYLSALSSCPKVQDYCQGGGGSHIPSVCVGVRVGG